MLIGVLLTVISFIGTTISFCCGNRQAFGGDDMLMQVGWYGSCVVSLALVAFIMLPAVAAFRDPQFRQRIEAAQRGQKIAPMPPIVAPAPATAPRIARAEPAEPIAAPEPAQPVRPRMAMRGPANRPAVNRPAINRPAPVPVPVPVSGSGPEPPEGGDFIAQALFDLKAPAPHQRKRALERLRNAPADGERRAEVAAAVEPLARDPDQGCRTEAIKVLGFWGSTENTPAIVKALNDPVVWVRWAALDAMTAIKDPAAAEAVASRLTDERGKAAAALKAIGPGAEPAVIKYLNHSDLWVRTEACKILEEIGGSEECKVALVNVVRRANNFGFDADAARSALSKIGMPSASARKKSSGRR